MEFLRLMSSGLLNLRVESLAKAVSASSLERWYADLLAVARWLAGHRHRRFVGRCHRRPDKNSARSRAGAGYTVVGTAAHAGSDLGAGSGMGVETGKRPPPRPQRSRGIVSRQFGRPALLLTLSPALPADVLLPCRHVSPALRPE
eukprot:6183015-Pleurochrysis_carterae.AAC.1